jgi:hypothetical protein
MSQKVDEFKPLAAGRPGAAPAGAGGRRRGRGRRPGGRRRGGRCVGGRRGGWAIRRGGRRTGDQGAGGHGGRRAGQGLAIVPFTALIGSCSVHENTGNYTSEVLKLNSV